MMSHGRATGDPKTLADTLAAYCHLLSSLPVWLEAAMVLHFQNFHRGTSRVTSPTKTFRIVLVVLALVALACVARVGIGRLLAWCLRPCDRMSCARVAHKDFLDLHFVTSIGRTRVD